MHLFSLILNLVVPCLFPTKHLCILVQVSFWNLNCINFQCGADYEPFLELFGKNLLSFWCQFSIKIKKIVKETESSNGDIWDEFSEQY